MPAATFLGTTMSRKRLGKSRASTTQRLKSLLAPKKPVQILRASQKTWPCAESRRLLIISCRGGACPARLPNINRITESRSSNRASIYVVKKEYSTLFVSPARRCLKPGGPPFRESRGARLPAPVDAGRLPERSGRATPSRPRPGSRAASTGAHEATSRIRAVRVSPDTR